MNKLQRDKYRVVIGLEVHAQLLTQGKIFASDANGFGETANTSVSAITLAHPGTLPKLNRKAIECAVKMGLACNAEITRAIVFDRKNYFYPDLPKGYQLTQDRTPICRGGYITISTKTGERKISLNRIHLEEDAGKSIHTESDSQTFVDLNRAGVPLIEIVTEPVIASAEEAGALMTEVRKLVRYLNICDGNMEEGSLRCDANVSLMLHDANAFGKKVEIKNMNSIRNVQRAIEYEIDRQVELLAAGGEVISETRTFNVADGKTCSMRAKEELNDYRYFPDPDLSPVIISDELLMHIKATLPALPRELAVRFIEQYKIPAYDANVLTDAKDIAEYFEHCCALTNNFKAVSNWVMGPVKSYLNESGKSVSEIPLTPSVLAQIISLVDSGKISFTMASQRLFPELLKRKDVSPLELADKLNLLQESDTNALMPLINEVIKEFPLKVEEFKNGKKGIVSMFMGEVMKRSKGKADPKMASVLITKRLEEMQ